MNNKECLGPWIRRFLMEHLAGERGLSPNTQISYRDTLILLLTFASRAVHQTIDRLCIEHLSENIIQEFLLHLEKDRGCGANTRNQRLAAIHALARFIALHSPEQVSWSSRICRIPFKRTLKGSLDYLEKDEMDTLLNTPRRHTKLGFRDYVLLLFLYNTGARAQEAASVKIHDLNLGPSASVKILGKGNKVRHCPLWAITQEAIAALIEGRDPTDQVFINRYKEPMTRFGIHGVVKRYALQAIQKMPSLGKKRISPHTIRHTTAVHLLRAGVDINTIRGWLGHVSLDTTNVYAEVDLEMKAMALAKCEVSNRHIKRWRKNQRLIEFLKAL